MSKAPGPMAYLWNPKQNELSRYQHVCVLKWMRLSSTRRFLAGCRAVVHVLLALGEVVA